MDFYNFYEDEYDEYDDDDDEELHGYSYKLNFIKKNAFFKKTNKGRIINVKLRSLQRSKNISFNNSLISSWVKKGMKLMFLKHYNIFMKRLLFLIDNEKSFFEEYPNTNFIYDLLNYKKSNYKLPNLLVLPLELLEHMFELKLKRLNKKMKRKFKKKYVYKVKYLYKTKRLKNTLNMFYFSSNFYKHKKYYDRIFFTFLYVIFDTRHTPIWDKKLNVYKVAYKFFKKY